MSAIQLYDVAIPGASMRHPGEIIALLVSLVALQRSSIQWDART